MERYNATTRIDARALAVRMTNALRGVEDFTEYSRIVIATVHGCGGAVWMCYDDAGGNAHSWVGEEFYKVRRVRNHPTLGRELSDAVNAKPARSTTQRKRNASQ